MGVLLGMTGLISWGYTMIGWISFREAGIPLPEWWYPAAATAILTLIIALCVCVQSAKSGRGKRDPRRLGVIRYDPDTEMWYCDPNEDQ